MSTTNQEDSDSITIAQHHVNILIGIVAVLSFALFAIMALLLCNGRLRRRLTRIFCGARSKDRRRAPQPTSQTSGEPYLLGKDHTSQGHLTSDSARPGGSTNGQEYSSSTDPLPPILVPFYVPYSNTFVTHETPSHSKHLSVSTAIDVPQSPSQSSRRATSMASPISPACNPFISNTDRVASRNATLNRGLSLSGSGTSQSTMTDSQRPFKSSAVYDHEVLRNNDDDLKVIVTDPNIYHQCTCEGSLDDFSASSEFDPVPHQFRTCILHDDLYPKSIPTASELGAIEGSNLSSRSGAGTQETSIRPRSICRRDQEAVGSSQVQPKRQPSIRSHGRPVRQVSQHHHNESLREPDYASTITASQAGLIRSEVGPYASGSIPKGTEPISQIVPNERPSSDSSTWNSCAGVIGSNESLTGCHHSFADLGIQLQQLQVNGRSGETQDKEDGKEEMDLDDAVSLESDEFYHRRPRSRGCPNTIGRSRPNTVFDE